MWSSSILGGEKRPFDFLAPLGRSSLGAPTRQHDSGDLDPRERLDSRGKCGCRQIISARPKHVHHHRRNVQASMPGHLDAGSSGYDAFYAMNLLPATHHSSPAMARSRQQMRQNKEWYGGKSDSARSSDRDHRRRRSKRSRRNRSRTVRPESPSNDELETEVATLKAELARRRRHVNLHVV